MKKNYVIDTNVLLTDANSINILQNGVENVVIIPWIVRKELDLLKKDNKLKHKVSAAIDAIEENKNSVVFLDYIITPEPYINDEILIEEILKSRIFDPVLVSNDKFLRVRAEKKEIKTEPFLSSNPFKSESQRYSGFVNIDKNEPLVKNCFYWKEGKLFMNHHKDGEKIIDYKNEAWTIKPKTEYQNAALELLLDDSIHLVTIQSEAGYGKTFLSLAAAFELVLQQKKYKKIFVIKPNIEIGEKLGYLPGNLDEKLDPYLRPVHDLVLKLHESRSANKVFPKKFSMEHKKGKDSPIEIEDTSKTNKKILEYIPFNYIRGMNLEDCVVIGDEIQNTERMEIRSLCSRMGENTKLILTGDVRQIDRDHLNQENNGLNWVVKYLKGESQYAHIILKGPKSRGPIADMVRKVGL